MTLRTDFKDDVLDSSMASKRQYELTKLANGNYNITDASIYNQVGSDFSAQDMNDTNAQVNETTDKIGLSFNSSIKLGSTSSGVVSDAENAEEVGSVIIQYFVDNRDNLIGKNYLFTVYDTTAHYWDWCVSLYTCASNGVTMGIMYQNNTTTPKLYKIRRTKGGADSVTPFSGGEIETVETTASVTVSGSSSLSSKSTTVIVTPPTNYSKFIGCYIKSTAKVGTNGRYINSTSVSIDEHSETSAKVTFVASGNVMNDWNGSADLAFVYLV